MNILGNKQVARSNNLFTKIKRQPPEWFERHGITRCDKCGGNGLHVVKHSGDGYSSYTWDTQSYCSKCYGTGHLGIESSMRFDDAVYMCPKCQTVGCGKCNMTGFVDWITRAIGN
ncbi:hypothetical protein KAR91_65095 [Candidatus Pacearchaeota archaeon]|nr:hypothetical protein [Candidatus Pacearchaeota archaeon]